MTPTPMLVAKAAHDCFLLPGKTNRHGLITGATGTGKTVTLQRLAEELSRRGVPVFMADIKGDLSGISQPGVLNDRLRGSLEKLGLAESYVPKACPTVLWDVFGERGHPLRATISELGPLLLSRLLELNETQSGVLQIVFKVADDNGLLLLDLKDLRALLQHVSEHAKELTSTYGNVSAASVGAIQRGLLTLETQGAEHFFGEPALSLDDLLGSVNGEGVVHILAADKLVQRPKLYATFLLWLLSELFENLPEVGDLEAPKLVFFFDEAHLLFNGAAPALIEKVEQVVRLIRSKGVGVFFVTQSPLDVPEAVLGQLGNRVQHALRAFTPRDQKAVKTVAETFRQNPDLDTAKVITELPVGEALLSFLDDQGVPSMVQHGMIVPPTSRIGAATEAERAVLIKSSGLGPHYDAAIDRESAYEMLLERTQSAAEADASKPTAADMKRATQEQKTQEREQKALERQQAAAQKVAEREAARAAKEAAKPTQLEKAAVSLGSSVLRGMGSSLGREITRGILGSLLGGTTTTRRRR